MYKNILLPTDGSELSEKAIDAAIRLAKILNAKVTGFHVAVEPRLEYYQELFPHSVVGTWTEELAQQQAEKYLDIIKSKAQEAGVVCECLSVTGISPAEEIIRAARERNCDLIFMASHGRKGLAGLLLGSETTKVLTHCDVPVTVYR
jgi:nucleotide-binding universal stress UspA family protein